MTRTTVGVIGGTGLYDIDQIQGLEEVRVSTPFGDPSDALLCGELDGVKMVFLPRHGRGHTLLPTEVPYRANIWALKSLGVEWIISVSAVGSLREELVPGDVVLVDQFIDLTRFRPQTFYGEGIVAHVSFGDPISRPLADVLEKTAREVGGGAVHRGGTYVCMEGPEFSTRAESHMYRTLGGSVIGMTNVPESKLAREAEIAYATVALVTDYDSWRAEEEAVHGHEIMETLRKNTAKAKQIVAMAAPRVPQELDPVAADALATALFTPKDLMPADRLEALKPILGRYFP